ncbi:MAG: hypothetical protein NVS2B5_29260 [Beijerinckiaceae bacterium]
MVMRADVLAAALDASTPADDPRPRLLMSPRGRPFTQREARALAGGAGVIIVCGRFEGVDERVIEACVRLLPGVMGKGLSGIEESYENGLLEYPHYTRPREWEGRAIPEVLLCGDHQRIATWRREEALRITRERRPDLIAALKSVE